MCTFSEALIEKGELRGETKGTIKGILRGKADSVLQLVKNHIASNIEQAMDMLSVEPSSREDAILKRRYYEDFGTEGLEKKQIEGIRRLLLFYYLNFICMKTG